MPIDTSPDLKEQGIARLKSVLNNHQRFVKAHAAEYLIWTGTGVQAALKTYEEKERIYGREPKYRVVIWRVLYQAESNPVKKEIWKHKILLAYLDKNGPDRIHAAETIAKLELPVSILYPEVTSSTLRSKDPVLQTFTLWASTHGNIERSAQSRKKLLEKAKNNSEKAIQKIALYALSFLKDLSKSEWRSLYKSLSDLPKTDENYKSLISMLWMTAPSTDEEGKLDTLIGEILNSYQSLQMNQRLEMARALAEKGNEMNLKLLTKVISESPESIDDPLVAGQNADLQAASAYAILKILHRQHK